MGNSIKLITVTPDVGVCLLQEKAVKLNINPSARKRPWQRPCLSPLRGERLLEVTPDNARRLGGVDPNPKPLLLVILDNGSGLRVVSGQTLSERIDVVIGSLDQRLASSIIRHGLLRRAKFQNCQKKQPRKREGNQLEFSMVRASTGRMDQTPSNPRDEKMVNDRQLDDVVQFLLAILEHRIELLGLRNSAWKTVQHEPARLETE